MLDGLADRVIEAGDGAQALARSPRTRSTWCWPTCGCPAWTAPRCSTGCPPRLPAIVVTGARRRRRRRGPRRCCARTSSPGSGWRSPSDASSGVRDDRRSAGPPLLLVDDDEAKRYLLATWLRRAGHTVTEAGTGREALEQAATAELVLLDVNLPDMSGFEVCRRIKSDPRTAAIPVIQVSATAVEVADRAHGLTQGADAYLIEPDRARRAARHGDRRAALLPGPAARRADGGHADRAGQRDAGHQRRRDLRRAGGGPRRPARRGSSPPRPC